MIMELITSEPCDFAALTQREIDLVINFRAMSEDAKSNLDVVSNGFAKTFPAWVQPKLSLINGGNQ
jgi:hypothetical protein